MVDGDERRGAGRGATAGFTHRPSPIRPDLSSMTLHAISAVLTNRYDQCRPARLRLRHFARSDPRPCAGAPGCRSGSRSIPAPNLVRTGPDDRPNRRARSEEHTSELQYIMRISYAVLCLKT